MVTIEEIYLSSPDFIKPNGCGSIDLSNDIVIWFGPYYKIKTEEEAQEVAAKILNALNA